MSKSFVIRPRVIEPIATGEPITVSAKEVGRLLGITERTVQNWAKAGVIKSCRIGGRVLYPLDAIRQLIDDSAVK